MSVCLSLLVFWLAARVQATVRFCPVSQSYSAQEYFHGYPLPIFYQNKTTSAYNCNVVNLVDPNPAPIQLCDKHENLCAIKGQNIRSALSVAPWPQYVDALARLGRDENMNVFYLGGSMTLGAEADLKCFCMKGEDFRCPSPRTLKSKSPSFCSWPSHMTRYLRRAYPSTKFHFHDYSAGGRTSQSSDFFIDNVHTSKANLSHPALFFLDYSVNDAQAQIFSGLETFMRTIIGHFGQHYGIKPTIVVIEQYPHALFKGPPTDAGLHTDQDYAMAYRRITKHYNAVLISVREVFWTYFGEPQGRNLTNPNVAQRYYPISPFEQYVHMWVHPPWYVHLFVADVLAACMLRITAQFASNSTTHVGNMIHNLHVHKAVPNITRTVVTNVLPPPLYDITQEMRHICSLSVPYIIDAVPHPPKDEVETDGSQGWTLTNHHKAAGWHIDNRAAPDKRILSFPIPGPVEQLRLHIVKVSYLISYEGMGTAQLYLCGQPLVEPVKLDGLWNGPASIPTLKSILLSDVDIIRCQSLPVEKHTVDIVYVPGEDQPELRSKHRHQFKVFDLRVCAPIAI